MCRTSQSRNKNVLEDIAGGPVVKNPPANAGDTGSIPGLGRSYMLRSNQAHAPQLLKPTHALEPVLSNKRSHRSEEPMHRNEKVVLLATTKEKPTQQRRHSAAINK